MSAKVFPARKDVLPEVLAFAEAELEQLESRPKAVMQVTISIEELFVNVASYAYNGAEGDVCVEIAALDDTRVLIRMTDSGTRFDPLAKDDPDITLSAEERRIGGLGIFMVKKYMDSMEYEYKDSKNVLTMIKTVK